MKTKKIKRVLAFFLAVVFAFSTCMTASPYTVQATEEPKLSVNVTLEDGVSTEDLIFDGLNLEFTDRNDQEIGSISIVHLLTLLLHLPLMCHRRFSHPQPHFPDLLFQAQKREHFLLSQLVDTVLLLHRLFL